MNKHKKPLKNKKNYSAISKMLTSLVGSLDQYHKDIKKEELLKTTKRSHNSG